ncbi:MULTISPECIES: hypothetical protein [Actinomycetes]|uniref:hypothetical protein n=1 Tax=Actinomycetes TaxID=1760 RepID=UPI0036DEA1BC
MTEKTIRVAVWEYLNHEGKRRFAYFGDVVDLPDSEIERGEQVEAFGADLTLSDLADQPDPSTKAEVPAEQPATPAEPGATTSDTPPAADVKLERPKNAAPKPEWVEYAAWRGIDGVEDMSKDELVAAVNALDAQ